MRAANSRLVFTAYWAAMQAASPFSTRLAGWAAHRLWFTPWRVDPGERARRKQAEWLAPTNPVEFMTTHGRIAGFSADGGPRVLLVHGWGESAASLGAFVAPLSDAGFQTVGIDLPGHGASVTAEPNIYVVAEVIRDVARDLGGVDAVIAHSMGAHSTMAALRDGLQVAAVVLLSPSSRLDSTLERFAKLMRLAPRAKLGLKRKLERRFGDDLWRDFSGPVLVRDVAVPALIFHDRDDPQVPFEDSVALGEEWPSARLVPTGSLGHGRILRDAQVIADAVTFLTNIKPSTVKRLDYATG